MSEQKYNGLQFGSSHEAGTSETEEQANTRAASDFTLSHLSRDPNFTSWDELNATSDEEREKIFLEKSKSYWQEFATSVAMYIGKDGQRRLGNQPDLDAKCSIGLFELAGFSIKNIDLVASGQVAQGKINTDTGNKHGVHFNNDTKTLIFDHHAPDSPANTSATQITYETLVSLGWLTKTEALDNLVKFITEEDNKIEDKEAKHFKNSSKRIFGIARYLPFTTLLKLFEAGQDPYQQFSDESIKLFDKKIQDQISFASKKQQENIDKSLERISVLEKNGLIVDTKFGRMLIDIGKTVPAGYSAARSLKKPCDIYVNWNPMIKSFFISSKNGFPENFEPRQGIIVRGTMWLKPLIDESELTITLDDVLHTFEIQTPPDKRSPLGKFLNDEKKGIISTINI